MPQLDTSTFASQIFWVIVGFSLFYFFISKFFCPRVEEIFFDRNFHIDEFLKEAKKKKDDSERIESEAIIELDSAKADLLEEEVLLMSAFQKRSAKEKTILCARFEEETREETQALAQAAEDAFDRIQEEVPSLVDNATTKISMRGKM
ncbi:MAG: hypothetical protein LBS14_01820 [Holosporaceae bacterium]|jgi:F-type H+-transporting ATPase subunit b|nr:hypothetical protein [Holosporaceae bacterium]